MISITLPGVLVRELLPVMRVQRECIGGGTRAAEAVAAFFAAERLGADGRRVRFRITASRAAWAYLREDVWVIHEASTCSDDYDMLATSRIAAAAGLTAIQRRIPTVPAWNLYAEAQWATQCSDEVVDAAWQECDERGWSDDSWMDGDGDRHYGRSDMAELVAAIERRCAA